MGYKDENIKHRMGIEGKPRYQCPHCKRGLRISKIPLMLICSMCNGVVKEDNIIINEEV